MLQATGTGKLSGGRLGPCGELLSQRGNCFWIDGDSPGIVFVASFAPSRRSRPTRKEPVDDFHRPAHEREIWQRKWKKHDAWIARSRPVNMSTKSKSSSAGDKYTLPPLVLVVNDSTAKRKKTGEEEGSE